VLYGIHHAILKEKANYENLKAATAVVGLEGSLLCSSRESSQALGRKGNSDLVTTSSA